MSILDRLTLAFKGQVSESQKSQHRPPLGRFFNAYGDALYNGDEHISYDAAVKEGYENNAIVQRSVRILTESVGSASIIFSSEKNSKITDLVYNNSSGQDLLETIAANLLLHGNAFIHILTNDMGDAAELYALRPERITIVPDQRGWPQSYQYRVGDQYETIDAYDALGRQQIIHIKGFHPSDDHYGLGCLHAAMQSIRVHNAATRWNRSVLDNAARPSGALVYDGGDNAVPLTAQQFDRLREEMEASFSGSGNAGRPMLLEGGLTWQAMSMSPADMDFVALKAAAARDIALAFGVPPMLLGIAGDNSYANYREANRALWRLTLLPLIDKILSALERGLSSGEVPWLDAVSLSIDMDKITALSEDRERLWAQVSAADFLSDAEKREFLGLDNLGTNSEQ